MEWNKDREMSDREGI